MLHILDKLDKNILKNKVRKYVLLKFPEDSNKLTNRLMSDMNYYIDGFVNCIKKMGEEPMRDKELESFITEEAISFTIRRIRDEESKIT